MSLTSPDTAPEAARALALGLRGRDVGRKLTMVGQLHRTARALTEAGVRRRRPHFTAEQVRRAVAERTLGPEEYARYAAAVGWGAR